jgi:hypothetical protein
LVISSVDTGSDLPGTTLVWRVVDVGRWKMTRSFVVAAVALVLGGLAGAQQPQIAWEPDFDETLKAAKSDGKPIFIALIMDNESANDQVAQTHFHDAEVVAESRNFHCLIASVGVHAATSAAPCPRFGCASCASHQKTQMRTQTIYLKSPEVSAPQFLFIKPDGETMLLRSVWLIGPAELKKKMRLALGYNDPSKAGDEVKRQQDDAARLIAEADDNNAVKRASALKGLSNLDDPRVMDFLIKQTGESVDEPRRVEAVNAMGAKGNAKALPVLLKLLTTGSAQLRNHVVIALEKLGMAEAGPGLMAALKKESKDRLRANLVRALAICDCKTADHMKAIVLMIGSGSQIERISAIRAAADVPMNDALKKALLAAGKDGTAQIRGAAFYVLAQRQVKEAVSMIEKAIPQEKVKEVKQLAESALSMLKQTDYDGPNADDIMKGFLVDDDLRKETN